MTSDLDIYRTANLLMKQRGALEAEIKAAQRADELLVRRRQVKIGCDQPEFLTTN